MKTLIFDNDFFNIKDTLECGQIFRFIPFKKGYKVFSCNKCAYVYGENNKSVICLEDSDEKYFINFFDLDRDYSKIYNDAITCGYDILTKSAKIGKGVRILNQDKTETLFSFIVSQNNNIPRIKGIIEKLCTSLGEKKTFLGEDYYAFPSPEEMAKKDTDFYSKIGLGYRAEYIRKLAISIAEGFDVEKLNELDTAGLKKALLSIYGVGPKVADCVLLFGFRRTNSFPVDTWIEKVYREDFKGELKDVKKISEWFVKEFKDNSGYFQQYLFYYKRNNG